VALLLAALIWGFVPVSTRHVVGTLTAGHILLARFLAGAVAAAVAIWLLRAPVPERSLWGRTVAFGLLGQLGFNVPLAYGIQHVQAGTVSLISGTSPIFIAVLAAMLLQERVQPRVIFGLALALVGTVVVTFVSGGEVGISGDQAFGALLILTSAVLWAIYSVMVKPWIGRIPPTSIPMFGSLAGLPLMLPLGASGFIPALGDLDGIGWLSVAQFALLASVAAPMLWAVGLGLGQASKAGLYLYLVPLFGVAASALLLGEPLGAGTIAGGALILLGVLIATVLPQRVSRAPSVVAVSE
jgi:drug/metabolite transporter (DMT)-like permease